jgi:A/G-specific adenine glycosylase
MQNDIEDLTNSFTQLEIDSIRNNLLTWYDENHRIMPWRESPNTEKKETNKQLRAYQVWVSEIMLQQTRVETVIDYYNKWMKRFPTLSDLAKADLEEVNKLWAGLGYYSRAKNLHEAAKTIGEGEIPSTVDELLKLKGVGK